MTRTELRRTKLVTEETGGEALVGFSSTLVEETKPVTSLRELQWSYKEPPHEFSVPQVETPVYLFPHIPETTTPIAAANPSRVAAANPTPVAVTAPAPVIAPIPALAIEKIIQSQSFTRDVPIAEAYAMDVTFERYKGSDDVTWFAIVRENQQVLPKQQVALRLEFPDGHISSASASIMDASKPVSIKGTMSLQDYCELASGAAMRAHLTATPSILRSTRELIGAKTAIPVPQPVWPECVPVKAASTPAASNSAETVPAATNSPTP